MANDSGPFRIIAYMYILIMFISYRDNRHITATAPDVGLRMAHFGQA